MITQNYNGFENLAGRVFNGTVRIQQLARRKPALAWSYECSRCGTSGVALHSALVQGSVHCPNASCCRVVAPSSSSGASIMQTPVGVRSADSARARDWHQQQATTYAPTEPTAADMRNGDPDALRHYLDYRDEQREQAKRNMEIRN
jgi:hypothetical protein